MRLRRLVAVLHRDTGYFMVGLVTIYAISGIAVNHIDAWNPNYAIDVTDVAIGPLTGRTLDALEQDVVTRLELDAGDVRGRRRPDPDHFIVFLPHGGEARIEIATGAGRLRRVTTRTVLFETNVLHLNHLKGVWTYVADAFSVLLLVLAYTGIFILKGRSGLAGRGKWFVAAGFLLPVAFVVVYYSSR